MSLSEDKWVMREFERDLLGKTEFAVRVLKDFQASSVLLVIRAWWRLVSKVAMWFWVKGCGLVSCEGVLGAGVVVLLREKMEGWRKE